MKRYILVLLIIFEGILLGEAGEITIGPELTTSTYFSDEASIGFGGGVSVVYDLTDFWGVSSTISYNKHFNGPASDLLNIYLGGVYTLDILRLVPSLEAGVSGSVLENNELNDQFFSLNVYFSFDITYLLDWERSISFFIRYERVIANYDEIFDAHYALGFRYNFIIESE